MVEAISEPAFVFDGEGEYLYCNQSARQILKILGYGEEGEPEHQEAFVHVLRFKAKIPGEPGLNFAGQRYEIVKKLFDEGILLRLIPIAADDHLLRISSSLSAVPWGVMTVDFSEEGLPVVFTNKKAQEILGTAAAHLPVMEVLSGFGNKEDIFSHINKDKVSFYDYEGRLDGKICYYRLHFIPYMIKSRYCMIVIEDVTEQKVIEGRFAQAQRLEALGQLAGGVAHDFNNILSIIDGYARFAKKALASHEDAAGYIDRISQAVQRGSALTGQLLAFGRPSVGKDTLINLGELVQLHEPLLRPLIDASINFSVHTQEGLIVEASPDDVCQMMINLCINARDAMPNGGSLVVEASKSSDGQNAVLRVTDTGCGMPPDVKARMFDPFFTTKAQGKGTGLGLSMVYGMVKEMKGDIDVVSKQDHGTSITISIPLSEREIPVHEIVEIEGGGVRLNGYTALVAEDEPDLLELISSILEDMGLNVLRASSGIEALNVQERYRGEIDFLLTDVIMPELNGVKLAEMFGAARPSSRIMFMSGYPAGGQMARVEIPEGALIMAKPVDFQRLSDTLKNMALEQNNSLESRLKKLTHQWKSL